MIPQLWTKTCLLLFFILLLIQCSSVQKLHSPFTVQLINEQLLNSETKFKNLPVGGLSSLIFHNKSKKFFALSDAKKNHRIYKLHLKKDKANYSVQIEDHILLRTPQSSGLSFNMDPEGLDIGTNNTFYIASEGQQIFKKPEPPQIFQFNFKGLWKSSWPTPSVFWDETQISKFGTQENKGFESLSIHKEANTLWVATEQPLIQDLINQTQNWVRLSEFKMSNKKLISQYAYPLHKLKGLTEIIFLKNKTFLTLERAYNKKKDSTSILLFFTNCQKALNVVTEKQLKKFTPCSKKLLWASKKERGLKSHNLEGMALGPRINSQKQLLVLVNDNNFNSKNKTQFLFFELNKIN